MRLTVAVLLFGCLTVSASGNGQTVSLNMTNASVKEVLKEIIKQTKVTILYKEDDLKNFKPVSITANNVPMLQVIDQCFKDQPFTYSITGKVINIIPREKEKEKVNTVSEVLNIDLHGRVLNDKNEPVEGVTVTIKGTRVSTLTNKNGEFALNAVDPNAILIFTHVSLEALEVNVNGRQNLVISMKIKVRALSDVTVTMYNTGYQQVSKERATGSFAKPDMVTFQNRVGIADVTDVLGRLDGLVAGLSVNVGSNGLMTGSISNGTMTRRSLIRGKGSVLLAAEPLYVINGIITNDFSSINQDDIEDITVLKDAAAAAIYGARAANGVIVITTKDGKKNQRLTVNYSSSLTIQSRPAWHNNKVLNSQQYIGVAKEIFNPVTFPWASVSTGYMAPHEAILYNQYRGLITAEQANKSLDSLSAIDNTSQVRDLLYQTPVVTNHTVSAYGGGSTYSYHLSLGYINMQGSRPGDKTNSYKINLSQNFNAGKRVNISLNTSLGNTIINSKGQTRVTSEILPYQLFRDASGNNINMPYMTGYGDSLRQNYQARSRINLDYYPLDEINYEDGKRNNLNLSVTANIGVKLAKGLRFAGTYGYLRSPSTNEYYSDNKTLLQRQTLLSLTVAPTIGSTPVYNLPLNGGLFTSENTNQYNWTIRNQLIYEANPRKGKDLLTLQTGQESQEQFAYRNSRIIYDYDRALGSYPVLNYSTLQYVSGTVTGGGGINANINTIARNVTRFYSYFALGSYVLNSKYSLDFSWRADHSSLFGSDVSSQSKPVWSVGGKWRINKESFMKQVEWVNSLSLRATYGIMGNSPYLGAATMFDVLRANTQASSGGIGGDALTIQTAANRKLAWERSRTTNIGIDFTMFNSRIGGSIEGYKKTTLDLLSSVQANPFTGFTGFLGRVLTNLGKSVNKGIEVTIASENIRQKNFEWTSRFVFSYNKNKLVSWGGTATQFISVDTRLAASPVEGYPLNSMFAYKFAGLDTLGDPRIQLANKTITKTPGAAQPADLVFLGVMQPKFNGGLTNTFSYKGFSLSVNMIYNLGYLLRRDVNMKYAGRLADRNNFAGNVKEIFLDRWKKPGDEAFTNVPSYVANTTTDYSRRSVNYYKFSDINVFDASYIKIRDISLSYNLSPEILKRLGLQHVSVFAQTNNFMLWKANHFGIDPEYHQDPINGILPAPYSKHSYSLGLNVTF